MADDLSKAKRPSLVRCGLYDQVRVLKVPPTNLKEQFVRKRMYDRICPPPIRIICPTWGEQYVGETLRLLCNRIKKYLDGIEYSTPPRAHPANIMKVLLSA
ncbi:hypothetical protein RB195_017265 [Necator americanus]|uniref:Uncharacterized protein n=1 Tax=Necator americanus TaxID=51031 RepID=A0ABR1C6H4_NECAM